MDAGSEIELGAGSDIVKQGMEEQSRGVMSYQSSYDRLVQIHAVHACIQTHYHGRHVADGPGFGWKIMTNPPFVAAA